MQFGCAAHHTVLEIGDDDCAVARAFFGVALDETVVHVAMEAVVAARAIKPQQMIAQ
jgi:hypothetical protein